MMGPVVYRNEWKLMNVPRAMLMTGCECTREQALYREPWVDEGVLCHFIYPLWLNTPIEDDETPSLAIPDLSRPWRILLCHEGLPSSPLLRMAFINIPLVNHLIAYLLRILWWWSIESNRLRASQNKLDSHIKLNILIGWCTEMDGQKHLEF